MIPRVLGAFACGVCAASGFVLNTAVRTPVRSVERSDASLPWVRQTSTGDKTSLPILMSSAPGAGSDEQLSRRGIIAGEPHPAERWNGVASRGGRYIYLSSVVCRGGLADTQPATESGVSCVLVVEFSLKTD